MADTHQEVVKVWIEPGCIVCDACETDCPEVFDVQEETCVIKPEATNPDFTKNLTPSINVAAEGCPVDVIKFETVEVEGPEPEAWKQAAEAESGAAAGARGGGGEAAGHAAAAAAAVSREAPDPKWVSLLEAAHVSGSRSSGGPPAELVKSAKVPAEAIQRSIPIEDAPDAKFALMVGSGFTRPKPSVADQIREKASTLSSRTATSRRGFLSITAVGWAAMAFVGATFGAWFQSFMVPKAPILPAAKVRVGRLENYSEEGVYEDYKKDGIWIVNLVEEGERHVVALSTICTHLGCIPNWLPGAHIFKCPCHGSGYRVNGVNFEGPAPRPLERYTISLDNTGVIIVDKSKSFRQELGQWADPAAFLKV